MIFFTQAIYGVLYAVTRSTALSWISFPANLAQVGDVIFRLPLKYDTPWPVSLLMIVVLIVAVRRHPRAARARRRGRRVMAPAWSPPTTCRSGTDRSSA